MLHTEVININAPADTALMGGCSL